MDSSRGLQFSFRVSFFSKNLRAEQNESLLTSVVFLQITCYHTLGDDVDGQCEGRGHQVAAKLTHDGDPSGRREVQVNHGHHSPVDLKQREMHVHDSGKLH